MIAGFYSQLIDVYILETQSGLLGSVDIRPRSYLLFKYNICIPIYAFRLAWWLTWFIYIHMCIIRPLLVLYSWACVVMFCFGFESYQSMISSCVCLNSLLWSMVMIYLVMTCRRCISCVSYCLSSFVMIQLYDSICLWHCFLYNTCVSYHLCTHCHHS